MKTHMVMFGDGKGEKLWATMISGEARIFVQGMSNQNFHMQTGEYIQQFGKVSLKLPHNLVNNY